MRSEKSRGPNHVTLLHGFPVAPLVNVRTEADIMLMGKCVCVCVCVGWGQW